MDQLLLFLIYRKEKWAAKLEVVLGQKTQVLITAATIDWALAMC